MIYLILDILEIKQENSPKSQNYQYNQEDKKLKGHNQGQRESINLSNFGKLVSTSKITVPNTLQDLREEQSQAGDKVKNLENHLMNLQIERDNVI